MEVEDLHAEYEGLEDAEIDLSIEIDESRAQAKEDSK